MINVFTTAALNKEKKYMQPNPPSQYLPNAKLGLRNKQIFCGLNCVVYIYLYILSNSHEQLQSHDRRVPEHHRKARMESLKDVFLLSL